MPDPIILALVSLQRLVIYITSSGLYNCILAVVWSGQWASGEQEYTCPQGRDWAFWSDDKWQHEKKLTAKCNPDVKKMKNKMGKMRRKCQKCRNDKCRQNCGAVQGLSQISPWF